MKSIEKEDGRQAKDFSYDALPADSRPTGRPELLLKDVVEQDMTSFNISPNEWQSVTCNRNYFARNEQILSKFHCRRRRYLQAGHDRWCQSRNDAVSHFSGDSKNMQPKTTRPVGLSVKWSKIKSFKAQRYVGFF